MEIRIGKNFPLDAVPIENIVSIRETLGKLSGEYTASVFMDEDNDLDVDVEMKMNPFQQVRDLAKLHYSLGQVLVKELLNNSDFDESQKLLQYFFEWDYLQYIQLNHLKILQDKYNFYKERWDYDLNENGVCNYKLNERMIKSNKQSIKQAEIIAKEVNEETKSLQDAYSKFCEKRVSLKEFFKDQSFKTIEIKETDTGSNIEAWENERKVMNLCYGEEDTDEEV